MKKYSVCIHYEGGFVLNIEAPNEDEAQDKAEQVIYNLTADDLMDNLADCFVDGIWETKENN